MTTSPSLLLVTDTPIQGRGGSERFLRNLLQAFPSAGIRADIVQLCEPLGSKEAIHVLPALPGITLHHLPVKAVHGASGRLAYRALRRMVCEGDYDLIHSQHEKSDILCALLPRGPRRARRLSSRRDMGYNQSPRVRWLLRLLAFRFDCLTAPCQPIIDMAVAAGHANSRKTACIPNGVDTSRFSPLGLAARTRLRQELGLPKETFVFGTISRLVEVKRHADLIHAFHQVSKSLPLCRLLIVGDGPLGPTLKAQVHDLGLSSSVRFMGERRDIERILPAFDCFVLPSRTEGMSNAALEAMSCALPVIATEVGGNPEIIHAPSTGLLVPPMKPSTLAAGMQTLASRPALARHMGQMGRERVLSSFSIAAMQSAYIGLYRSLSCQASISSPAKWCTP